MEQRPPTIAVDSFHRGISEENVRTISQNLTRTSSPSGHNTPEGPFAHASSIPGAAADQLLSGKLTTPSVESFGSSTLHPPPSWNLAAAERRGSKDLGSSLRHEYIPYLESRAPSRGSLHAAYEAQPLNSQNISEKYAITPEFGLLLFPNQQEDDDALHQPDESDAKEARSWNVFTKRGLVELGGLVLFVGGILVLFIGYPILWVFFFTMMVNILTAI